MRFRFDIGHLAEHGDESRPTAPIPTLGEILFCQERGHLLSNRRVDQLVDRNALLLGYFTESAMDRCRQTKAQRTHCLPPIIRKNSCGLTTRTPNRWSPAKSLRLCVTTASARPATATSAIMSSFGSRSRGRQR